MQRDMKIGMALGLALVGIVGALFFRREPDTSADKAPPPLPNAEQLDREIAEKAKAPYIQGLEEFDTPAVPAPSQQTPPARPGDTKSARPGVKNDAAKSHETALGTPSTTLEPLGSHKPDTAAAEPGPAHNRDWTPTGPSATPGKPTDPNKSNPASTVTGTGRTHVIRPGDTLSGLATRYLGSSGRYREIYEANRDQLRSADDVREGMTLKIPDAGKLRDAKTATETADTARSESGRAGTKARNISNRKADTDEDDDPPAKTESTDEAPKAKLRFVPVNRGPFSAGRTAPPESK
ncbi:MAG: LysM peptidoglycan-binding domain-containing protein [Planctomycetia bacterium]|nr:LysM peptidoglycan-binding domain-containing protein [Planctomycetia bacterium]